MLTWACCLRAATRARVAARADDIRGRLLIALLTYLFPLLRCLERYRWWARGLSAAEPVTCDRPARALPLSWRKRSLAISFWTEHGLEKEAILHGLREALTARNYFVRVDRGWSDWDLEVHGGIWSRGWIKVATEHHGGARRVLRVKCTLRVSLLARLGAAGALATALFGIKLGLLPLVIAGAGVAAVGGVALLRESLSLGSMLYQTLHTVARRARLHYAPRLQGHAAEVK